MAKCEHCGDEDFDGDIVRFMEYGNGGIGFFCVSCVRKWRKLTWNMPEQIEIENISSDMELYEMILQRTGDLDIMKAIQALRKRAQELDKKFFKLTQEFIS